MTDPLLNHMLRSIRHAVMTEIAPAVQGRDARLLADMVARLLDWAVVRLEQGNRVEADHEHALLQILGEGDRTERLGEIAMTSDRTRFTKLLSLEDEYVVGRDPEGLSSASDNYAAGKSSEQLKDAGPPRVADESLTAYLRARFPEYPEIAATETTPLTGGFGKDTILFTIRESGPLSGSVVMRKDLPISPIDAFAVDEFPVLQAVQDQGIPVPEPLWSEPDRTWFGGGFIVVRRMPGSIDTESWTNDPIRVRAFAKTLAGIMARIHTLGADDLPAGAVAPASASEGTRLAIHAMRDLFRRKEDRVNTRLEAAFAWLLDNVPDCQGAPARLVHGDIGFHNLLIDQGNVSAVLDWEFAHLGDPAEDVSYVRPFVERVMPWQQFLDLYRDSGGFPYSDEQDRFFAVWRNARNAASCTGSAFAFRSAEPGSIKLATGGLIYGPRFEMEALRQIQEIL